MEAYPDSRDSASKMQKRPGEELKKMSRGVFLSS